MEGAVLMYAANMHKNYISLLLIIFNSVRKHHAPWTKPQRAKVVNCPV